LGYRVSLRRRTTNPEIDTTSKKNWEWSYPAVNAGRETVRSSMG